MESPARFIATILALAGFAIAGIAGLAAGNGASTILAHALLALVVCHVVGLLIGAVGVHVAQRAAVELVESGESPAAPPPSPVNREGNVGHD